MWKEVRVVTIYLRGKVYGLETERLSNGEYILLCTERDGSGIHELAFFSEFDTSDKALEYGRKYVRNLKG